MRLPKTEKDRATMYELFQSMDAFIKKERILIQKNNDEVRRILVHLVVQDTLRKVKKITG